MFATFYVGLRNEEKGLALSKSDRVIACLRTFLAVLLSVSAVAPAHAQQGVLIDPRTVAAGQDATSPQASQQQSGTLQQNSGANQNQQDAGQILAPRTVTDTSRQTLNADQLRAAETPASQLFKPLAEPSEFENYIARVLGRKLPRFGANLLLPSNRDFAQPATASVPPSYVVRPGDTIVISLTGSIEGSVKRKVDTNGKIYLEGVGAIRVAGVRHADLRDAIAGGVGTQYRGFTVSVALESLRGIRVYVTGLANNPGAFTVSSLSTMANALLQAGGPSSGGSLRSVKLYRNGREVGSFDLYELLRGGNRIHDLALENEDVLFIPPAGRQVAIIGSVQEEAIYEALPGESVEQMVMAAGGPNTLADTSRVILYRNNGREIPGPRELSRAEAAMTAVETGDILQLLSTGSLVQPLEKQSVLVRIEGEVDRPGVYFVAPTTSLGSIIEKAGGLATGAFIYGTRLTRQSVRQQQKEGYREAIRQLEVALTAAPLSGDTTVAVADRQAQIAAARATLERLKQAEPDGRVVMQIAITDTALPGAVLMENNDEIYIPPRPTTVGVFGAVYRPASFLLGIGASQRVKNYVELAGGTIRAADRSGIFVVRANGEVLTRKRGAWNAPVYPGDVIFVPVKTQGSTFWAKFKDITQTLFQLGLAAATVISVTK